MTNLRAEKIARVAEAIPVAQVEGEPKGDLLVVGWGSTYGPISAAVRHARSEGFAVSHLHLRYLNPLPKGTEALLENYKHVLVPENNMGQLTLVLRNRVQKEIAPLSKVTGQPFLIREIIKAIEETLKRDQ
jgi:2-oxoglutarate ferredoxin oxidoreductase subunit alpha